MQDHTPQIAELRQLVDRLSSKIEYLYRELNVRYLDENVPLYVLQAQEMVRTGRDSEAIKIVREHTAIGIVEAREVVAMMMERLAPRPVAEPLRPSRP